MQEREERTEYLKWLPSIDELLKTGTAKKLIDSLGTKNVTKLARFAVNSLRRDIQICTLEDKEPTYTQGNLLDEVEKRLELAFYRGERKNLRRVINATGVIIHTNLGRAPLSNRVAQEIFEKSSRYCNLEYNLENGKRGKRGIQAENLLAELTNAEAALVVNNCAAATVLVLTALCKNGEAIVSRGELVEIGGDFRVPDMMTQSGASLIEIGTTNRTRITDYERAISEKTRLILKVHPSNYRIVGFTSTPGIEELANLARQNNILLYEDAGSGAILDLSKYGLADEPVISHSINAGADLVTFSGDKLLGAVQAGLIVGKARLIENIRRHPLYRALRTSKLIYAAIETTLSAFRKDTAIEEVPVLKMLSVPLEMLRKRTEDFVCRLEKKVGENSNLKFKIVEGESVVGGGAAPAVRPTTVLLRLEHKNVSVNRLEKSLRLAKTPVVTRIMNGCVLIDLRTVFNNEERELLEILSEISK